MNARMSVQNQGNDLARRFGHVRAATLAITAPLSAEDMVVQSMPDASPVKWHLAHTTWFFETFLLERFDSQYRHFHPQFKKLFNSYYVTVGDRHPRPQRGLLTRPSVDEVRQYRQHVDAAMTRLIAQCDAAADPEFAALLELGLQHEQQHQELMLTDLKHLLSLNPLLPAAQLMPPRTPAPAVSSTWLRFEACVSQLGNAGQGFCFDNELPRHKTYLADFEMASHLVTNAEYLRFMNAGAYRQSQWWLSEGIDWVNREAACAPLYWHERDGAWFEFTLAGLVPLDLNAPVLHLSYFEADAYARFASARLPTEFEWEHAAVLEPDRLRQLHGHAWQWTASSYAPYPGFAPWPGAVGEYNGKFMVNQYVLRGSSAVTPAGHSRVTYRNFFPASARWQFTGLRLARSITDVVA
jgi:ergothioneine biosynthesis protein EgtB